MYKKKMNKFKSAIERVKQILDCTRNPKLLENVDHTWTDKYTCTEFVTNVMISACRVALKTIGLETFSDTGSLKFVSNYSVKFKEEREKKVLDLSSRAETEFPRVPDGEKFVRVIEYVYNYTFTNQVHLVGKDGETTILSKSVYQEDLVELTKQSDIFKTFNDLTLDLEYLNEKVFHIDRSTTECKTPSNNPEILNILEFVEKVSVWCKLVLKNLDFLFGKSKKYATMKNLNDCNIFIPIVPLGQLEDNEANSEVREGYSHAPTTSSSAALVGEHLKKDANELLRVQEESIRDIIGTYEISFITSLKDAKLFLIVKHLNAIVERYKESICYIEGVLRRQLIRAIGKEITNDDFAEFLDLYHKNDPNGIVPKMFSFLVSRPGHTPEGSFSIESNSSSRTFGSTSVGDGRGIMTLQKELLMKPTRVKLTESINITLNGPRVLHSFIDHSFGNRKKNLDLIARARRFSSFILLVGNMTKEDLFEPKGSLIVQNKDKFEIELLLERLPTALEFSNAIKGLSPEQEKFAKTWRDLQLSKSVFAVAIVQIKPQLERLLNLPNDSLIKEIQMTQDLMDLFIRYQIPSDLLSFDQNSSFGEELTVSEKVSRVKEYIARVHDTIEGEKKKELDEAEKLEQVQTRKRKSTESAFFGSVIPLSHGGTGNLGKPINVASCTNKHYNSANCSSFGSLQVSGGIGISKDVFIGSDVRLSDNSRHYDEEMEDDSFDSIELVENNSKSEEEGPDMNFMVLAKKLDQEFGMLKSKNARPTIITLGQKWTRVSYESLISKESKFKIFDKDEKKVEENSTFDLLDCITRSGNLEIHDATLHIIVPITHSFDDTLIDTVIKENINPIDSFNETMSVIQNNMNSIV
jgi:hypothetical protein